MSAGATLGTKKTTRADTSESRRFGSLVRIGDDVAEDAKLVANLRGISMAELLTELLRPILKEAVVEEADRLQKRVRGRAS